MGEPRTIRDWSHEAHRAFEQLEAGDNISNPTELAQWIAMAQTAAILTVADNMVDLVRAVDRLANITEGN